MHNAFLEAVVSGGSSCLLAALPQCHSFLRIIIPAPSLLQCVWSTSNLAERVARCQAHRKHTCDSSTNPVGCLALPGFAERCSCCAVT